MFYSLINPNKLLATVCMVCMCVYVTVCVRGLRACVHTCMYVCMHVCMHACIYANDNAYMLVPMI